MNSVASMLVPETVPSIWFSPEGASDQLRSLEPIFTELRSVHRKYIDRTGDDCAYWYGERAQLGLFSAAVWLRDGIALEEYGDTKRKQRVKKRCRYDLWLEFEAAKFCCEAKYVRLNLRDTPEKLAKKTKEKLDKARGDVASLKEKTGLALCFAVPRFREAALPTMHGTLARWIELVRKGRECQASVWLGVSLTLDKNEKFDENHASKWGLRGDGKDKNCFYPGVLLTIAEVNKQLRGSPSASPRISGSG